MKLYLKLINNSYGITNTSYVRIVLKKIVVIPIDKKYGIFFIEVNSINKANHISDMVISNKNNIWMHKRKLLYQKREYINSNTGQWWPFKKKLCNENT